MEKKRTPLVLFAKDRAKWIADYGDCDRWHKMLRHELFEEGITIGIIAALRSATEGRVKLIEIDGKEYVEEAENK